MNSKTTNVNEASGLLRLPRVIDLTQLSSSGIRNLEQEGKFPHRFKIGGRAVGWKAADVLAWIESRAQAAKSANPKGA